MRPSQSRRARKLAVPVVTSMGLVGDRSVTGRKGVRCGRVSMLGLVPPGWQMSPMPKALTGRLNFDVGSPVNRQASCTTLGASVHSMARDEVRGVLQGAGTDDPERVERVLELDDEPAVGNHGQVRERSRR